MAALLLASGTANAFICLLAGADNKRMRHSAPYIPWQPQRAGYQALPPIIQPAFAQPTRSSTRSAPRRPMPPGSWRPLN